ncbi:hypothetical protein [Bradyrhizobium sp. USDA 4502]
MTSPKQVERAVAKLADKDHPLYWFMSFAQKPLFTPANVIKLAPGLTASTLQNWANREIVEALYDMKEERGRRYFDSSATARVVFGHRLISEFKLQPVHAMLLAEMARIRVIAEWLGEGISPNAPPDAKIPIHWDHIENYWFLYADRNQAERNYCTAVTTENLGSALTDFGGAIVLPYGRDVLDLAIRAKKLFHEGKE